MPVLASMTLASVLPCWRIACFARAELLVEVEEAVAIASRVNWLTMIVWNRGPTSEPGTWSSASPPSKASMLLTLP